MQRLTRLSKLFSNRQKRNMLPRMRRRWVVVGLCMVDFVFGISLLQMPQAVAAEYHRAELEHNEPHVLDVHQIKRVLKQGKRMVAMCYERALKHNPALHGKVGIQFTIGSKGLVTQVVLVDSSLSNKRVTDCIVRGIHRWVFPPPLDAEVMVYTPFDLKPVS